jgi:hypothetical protein
MTATIERIDTGPFRAYTAIKHKVWAIIFHTSQGRELFAEYDTHAEARADADKYNIKLGG